MKKLQTIVKITIVSLLILGSTVAIAETVQTNIQGVILKNVRCANYGSKIWLNVSNRTNNAVKGKLRVTIFDADGDPIDNGMKRIYVGPVSGDSIFIDVSCASASKYAFRIE